MKFLKNSLFLLLFSTLIFSSCKNDLELNAPYKEIPSIYAVLNPYEREQTIRINKTFLGEGDANQMAKVADSVNYQAGELTVTLNRFVNGTQTNASQNLTTVTFTESVIQTNPGAFNTTQRVYKTSEKLFTSGDYVLTVKNNKTGNVFTAKSTALDSVDGHTGYGWLTKSPVYPYPKGTAEELYVDYSVKGNVHFAPNAGKIYQLVLRMYYYDSLATGNNIDFIDYAFDNRLQKDITVKGSIRHIYTDISPNELFTAVGIALSKKNLSDNVAGRRMYRIDYLIYSSTQEYLDYLEYAKPSFSFNQNKPLYSNFENGAAIGIFTFRTRCLLAKEMSSGFISEFARNSNTCKYKFFIYPRLELPGCR